MDHIPSTPPERLEELFQAAYAASYYGRWDEAIPLLHEILRAAPDYSIRGIYARDLLNDSLAAQESQANRAWWRKIGLPLIFGVIAGLGLLVGILYLIVSGMQAPQAPAATRSVDSTLTTAPLAQSPTLPGASSPVPTPTLQATVLSPVPPPCTDSGLTWTRPKDLMVLTCIPSGPFIMGMDCSFQGCQDEVPPHTLNLEAFWIDRTEVTNAMFGLFVQETNYVTGADRAGASEVLGRVLPVPGANWLHPQGLQSNIADRMDHPVVQINWYGADAYCKWAGGRLPSEAQWEKAARGTKGALFPWGNALGNGERLNFADSSLGTPSSNPDYNDGYQFTAPVGSYPAGASPFGVLDMAGNAWEWTRSLLKPYPYVAGDGRETVSPTPDEKVVMRGGGWYDDLGSVRSTLRYGGNPTLSHDATGFRCIYP